MNKLIKLIPLITGVLLVACSSGGSSWQAGNLGSLQIAMESTIFNVSESKVVMASLSGAQQGTDPIGSATVYFKVATSYINGIFESSNIATLAESSCVINNPISADLDQRSCFVTLQGVSAGGANVYTWAVPNSPQNTNAPTNYNPLESYPYVSFTIN